MKCTGGRVSRSFPSQQRNSLQTDESPDGLRIVYAAGVPGDRADQIFTIQHNGSAKHS